MRKWIIPLVILLACAIIFIGCSSDETTAPTTPAVTTTQPTTTKAPVTTTSVPVVTTSKPPTSAPLTTTSSSTAPVTTPKGNQTYGGILKFISSALPGTPIGWMSETFGASTTTMQLSMEFCLKELVDGTLIPNLALSYDLDATAEVPNITLHLRKGVKFQDGSDFNAQVLKWNLESVAAGTTNRGTTGFWKSYEVIDDYTLKVNFNLWQNRLLRGFADAATYICSKAAYEKNGLEWIRWHMVGTSGFTHTDFQRDVVTKVRRFDGYWDQGKPYLDGIDMLYVSDELTRIALFKSGGGDVLDLVGNGRVANELQSAGYQIISKTGGVTVLVPDSANPDSPWSNLKVRMAAEYAIDKESYAKTFGFGYWKAAYQFCSPSTACWDPNFAGSRVYDIAKGKALLAEAGYPNGFKTRLIVATGGNRDIPVAIQSFLAKIGIQADLEYKESASFSQQMTSPWNNALILNSFIEYPNENATFNFHFGTTSAFWKSLKKPDNWNAMFTETMSTPLPDVPLMKKVIRALYDEQTVITLNYGASMYAAQPPVRDTGLDKRSSIYWNQADTWLAK